MEYIDLYDIHDAVFTNRTECEACPSIVGSGIDAECVQLNESKHLDCPFVDTIYLEAECMVLGNHDDLLIEFIEESMELDLSPEDKAGLNLGQFDRFIANNASIFKQKLTDFFSKRASNDNNYRSVLRV
jgi:hypothetical protein